ncbi:hypothetical protein ACAH01_05840 [Halomicrobium sp. HM KBTZ05]|uniref:hypothetical protein n=1 Tax=Halomicrobium sp. HM KBTZ05 TaxID=3242663 RepID=UPI0035562360
MPNEEDDDADHEQGDPQEEVATGEEAEDECDESGSDTTGCKSVSDFATRGGEDPHEVTAGSMRSDQPSVVL